MKKSICIGTSDMSHWIQTQSFGFVCSLFLVSQAKLNNARSIKNSRSTRHETARLESPRFMRSC